MARRVKEQGFDNEAFIGHDNVGNYISQNGIRYYSRTVAMNSGDSTTVTGHTAPRGSLAKTTHATGRDTLWIAGAATWTAVAGATGAAGAPGTITPTYAAILTQAGTAAPSKVEVHNDLSATVVWTRTSAGLYVGTLVAAFVNAKTVFLTCQPRNGSTAILAKAVRISADVVQVHTYAADGTTHADLVGDLDIVIQVYP